MFTQKLLRLASKIALFLVIFASLAPSVSHALAAQSNAGGQFLQEICASNGSASKVVIQIVTTKGQQLATVLETNNTNSNTGLVHHLEHCPFCGASATNIAIAAQTPWVFAAQAQSQAAHFDYAAPLQPRFIQTAHPSRAPPAL